MSNLSTKRRRCRIIFVTGTDTGAGKTVLTGLLLACLRHRRVNAVAMKPFSTGNRDDAKLLRKLIGLEMTLDEVNPFHFRRPLAPLISARLEQTSVPIEEVLARIGTASKHCDVLLLEGAGGLMAPLGPGFCLWELIQRLRGEVVIAAQNKLGVINHTLLTLDALRKLKAARPRVALMGCKKPDDSAATNEDLLRECETSATIISIPWLAGDLGSATVIQACARQTGRRLAKLLA